MNTVIETPPATPTLSLMPRIRSALFDIASREPEVAPRWTLRVIAVLIGVLVLWTILARLDIVAVAEGRLVPQTDIKIVQPAEAGIVREILVDEGDQVTAGQVMLRLDPTENAADSTATGKDLVRQQLQIRRIDAELQGTEIPLQSGDDALLFAEAKSQLHAHRQQFRDSLAQESAARERATRELAAAIQLQRKLEQTQASYDRAAEAYEKLANDKLVGPLQAEERRRAATEHAQDFASQRATVESLRSAVSQSSQRLAQLKSTYESDLHTLRADTTDRLTQVEQQLTKLQYRQTHLELKAPQAGTVKELATTTLGAVVQPGTVLLSLVPADEPLLAEVSVPNQDIGFVKAGQNVRLKLATYPFQKYGMVEGVVKTVIADSTANNAKNDNAPDAPTMPFKAVIQLKEQVLKLDGMKLPLVAGMQLSAEIVEGKRTVLEYLLSPVQRVTSEAGRER